MERKAGELGGGTWRGRWGGGGEAWREGGTWRGRHGRLGMDGEVGVEGR